jgi:hypothetical protein
VSGKKYNYKSAAGHTYSCKLVGDRLKFRWNNEVSDAMASYKTKYAVEGAELTVTIDLVTNVFKSTGNAWTLTNQ